ncbi:hypothetical protein IWX49DRAFT_557557 [Phyllosticta citricarpa]|uniref:Uncharacterized protein n=2 Tax=Phyllosticta TaxID=121621 RepID=A0ABR1LC12_9PEZI
MANEFELQTTMELLLQEIDRLVRCVESITRPNPRQSELDEAVRAAESVWHMKIRLEAKNVRLVSLDTYNEFMKLKARRKDSLSEQPKEGRSVEASAAQPKADNLDMDKRYMEKLCMDLLRNVEGEVADIGHLVRGIHGRIQHTGVATTGNETCHDMNGGGTRAKVPGSTDREQHASANGHGRMPYPSNVDNLWILALMVLIGFIMLKLSS